MNTPAPQLLLVDDDVTFCTVLARALGKRGYAVHTAHDVATALEYAEQHPPAYAVIDLKLPGETGLRLIARLRQLDPLARIVMLTGYASITTAIEAIKLGATHYLAKPAEVDEIVAALHKDTGDANIAADIRPPSVERLEWEHIQRVLNEHDGNISATARALNMHRRTLQRKLFKHPVRN
ncbi:two-component system response regulator [Sulfuriferula sp. AH1]|uniref:response regulator transcription factor n=1 Tax=Sulfuriferula sp. AH1 TaxID=1985873 RepID=UPI000B3B0BDF|nr:response regulator transcription factor [Sulfuriferula sp. AH1]ARU30364.1 two-component system response regulator [Sulfuriferula sp. AH1]